LAKQCQKQVLPFDLAVTALGSQALRLGERILRLFGQAIHVHG